MARREGATAAVPVEAPHLPVLLDLRADGGLGVVGPRGAALEVLSAVVAQLAVLHAPGEVDLLLLAPAARLAEWSWARWLPHLRVLGDAAEAEAELAALISTARGSGAEGPRRWTVLVLDEGVPPSLLERLHQARGYGVVVVTSAASAEELATTGGAVVRMTGEIGTTGVLMRRGEAAAAPVVLDRLAQAPAALLARDLAPLGAPTAEGSVPTRVRLLDLPGPALRPDDGGELSGRWSTERGSLIATLGSTADGPVSVDLCAVGPHALVAGTTGAGKSELLQTLIAGLALQHPPDRAPSCSSTTRAGRRSPKRPACRTPSACSPTSTRSPRPRPAVPGRRAHPPRAAARRARRRRHRGPARRRRARPAGHRGRRVRRRWPRSSPAFVPGLVGIAQRGRSLGVHLVLATQRPGGVVSPEIRANCTLRICLRTTDEADSRDVLGTPDAAHLPVGLPGRAFLRVRQRTPGAVPGGPGGRRRRPRRLRPPRWSGRGCGRTADRTAGGPPDRTRRRPRPPGRAARRRGKPVRGARTAPAVAAPASRPSDPA